MDIKAKIEEIVKKITANKDLLAAFKKAPKDTVRSLITEKVDDDVTEKIVEAVKAKIKIDDSGIVSKLGGLFKK